MILITLYLSAIVLANLSVAYFGPGVAIINAFIFIGLDLTTRDILHDRWHGRNLWRNMFALIATGSIVSALLNRNASQIALASFVAFSAAGLADTLIYMMLNDHRRVWRINGSNVVSSAVDSAIFPALAFGFPLLFPIMAGQFVAKIVGGFVWSFIVVRIDNDLR